MLVKALHEGILGPPLDRNFLIAICVLFAYLWMVHRIRVLVKSCPVRVITLKVANVPDKTADNPKFEQLANAPLWLVHRRSLPIIRLRHTAGGLWKSRVYLVVVGNMTDRRTSVSRKAIRCRDSRKLPCRRLIACQCC